MYLSSYSAAQEPKKMVCTGKVIDAEGQPVAGAKVGFHQIVNGDFAYTYDIKLTVETTTKADGMFSLAVVGIPKYRYGVVIAQKQGLAMGWAEWRMRGDRQRDIKLGQPQPLTGVVVDEGGKPLAEAGVFIAASMISKKDDEPQSLPYPVARQLLTSRTDAAGRFTFVGLPADATFELGAYRPGYATMISHDSSQRRTREDGLTFRAGQANVKLVMPVEAKITGTVVQQGNGRPIAGLAIMVRSTRMGGYSQPAPVISQQDGTFEIGSLLADTYSLLPATPQKSLADWVAQPINVMLDTGQTKTGLRMEVGKGGLLEVRVTETGGNGPLEGASLSVYDRKRRLSFSGRTDNGGVGRIRLYPGAYELNVYKEGYSRKMRQEPVMVEDGRTRRLVRQLTSQPKIGGAVRDEKGMPVEGVRLKVCPAGFQDVASDSEGIFEVSWDPGIWGSRPKETTFWLLARHEKLNLAAVEQIDKDTIALDVKLKPGVVVTGNIVAPDGKPIPHAQLTVMLDGPGWGSSLGRGRLKVDENGQFEISAIPAGHSYRVTANAAGYGSNRSEFQADDAVNNRLNLEPLTLAVANLSVSGQIVDTQGNPVADSSIASSGYGDGQPDRVTAHSDSQGRFNLEGVCEGKITIRVDANRDGKRLSARVITNGGATGIRIVAREGRAVVQNLGTKAYKQIVQTGKKIIAGVAVDENGSPVAGVPVGVCCRKTKREDGKFTWTFSSFTDLKATTDQQGRFAIELQEGEEFNLLFSPDKHAAMIVYDIPAGKKDLKVTLPEGGTVSGRLVRVERSKKVPIPNADVKIEQPDRASYTHLGFHRDQTTVTDLEGRFQFEHLRTKIRPHGSMRDKQWKHIARVWKISYGETSETIAFYDGTKIENFELIVKPDPAQAQSLVGKALPAFDGIEIDLPADYAKGKAVLVCFFDMEQRPSRYSMFQLAKKADQLTQKGVTVVAVQISQVDEDKLSQWAKNYGIPFPVGMAQGDQNEIRAAWGVKSLPWLILTDKDHTIREEGFGLTDLDDRLEQ
jgi:uncharacterized GH25 family protein/peroxiredoxin